MHEYMFFLIQNVSIAKTLSGHHQISQDAFYALNLSCALHFGSKAIKILGDEPAADNDLLSLSMTTKNLQQNSYKWLESVVNQSSFPINCSENISSFDQQLDDVCTLWDYSKLAQKHLQLSIG